MTSLHTLPKIGQSKRIQIGRGYGSGRGAKSGRGTTRHQAAREKIKADYEGGQNKLTKKFPLLRGKSRNKSIHSARITISLDQLDRLSTGSDVTLESLLKAGIISQKDARMGVKVVNKGTLTKKLVIHVPISKTAAEIIAGIK